MAKQEDFNFNLGTQISEKLRTAVKNTAIRNIKANLGASHIIEETKTLYNKQRDIEYNFSDVDEEDNSAFLNDVDRIVNITFQETDFINGFGNPESTPEINLEIANISLSASKRVIETPILNQKGSIKEIVGQNDYQISISGVLVGQFGFPTIEDLQRVKPIDAMRNLIEIAEAKVSIKIVSDYLDNFNIERLMIKSFSFPQNLDSMNLQSFTLTCSSDDNDLTIL